MNTLTSKPKTRSQSHQTHDNELVGTSLDQDNSMLTDTPEVLDEPLIQSI